ncbi:MAG: threonine synthase [Candidatus Goldbacteria bacterium]|nr:threonine synthase [Candidatus Goldiibacteriota bacterium]
MQVYKGVIERYREYLPVTDKTPIITLLEGNTPLIRFYNIEKMIGENVEVYGKYEGLNPTGSFKDRGMTLAISKALEKGVKATICASTGNTSASAAAYSMRAGLKSYVIIPNGYIALGKLSQALIHGAKVIAVEGNFDVALEMVKKICENYPIELVNSLNFFRIEGQKTGAFEIVDVLGDAPDFHCIPVGNAGNITAYWKGYKEYKEKGKAKKLPKMLGFQAAGAAPIVLGKPIETPETIATAIRIGNPASWKQAVLARDESGGVIDTVTDEEIIQAYKLLAEEEGIFVEPASAASVAGLIKYARKKYFPEDKKIKIVCILTGHGLKDPDRAIKSVEFKPAVVAPDFNEIIKIIKQ